MAAQIKEKMARKCSQLKNSLFLCAMIEYTTSETTTIKSFQPISLPEMDGVKLMTRADTKFIFQRSELSEVLARLTTDYRLLDINGNRLSTYKTLYYDTADFRFFLDHHNGRGNRFKVRIRNYVESNLFFLEIKNKFKEKTFKSRIKIQNFEQTLQGRSANYVSEVIGNEIKLEAKLWNTFTRMTLVSKEQNERLTLDLNLAFDWDNKTVDFDHVVIAELKQERANRNAVFYDLMKKRGVRPNGMSKYCVGAASLFPELKQNNFKEKLLLIDKLQ